MSSTKEEQKYIYGKLEVSKFCGENLNELKKPGVWALFEKNKDMYEDSICLQVGQSENIGKEIKDNIYYLNSKESEKISKKYVNQFGESMFDYPQMQNHRYFLYREINNNYFDLEFIYITNIDKYIDRKNVEKYIAYKTKSLYWRNGRPYKKGKDNLEKEKIDELRRKKVEELKEKIDFDIIKLLSI